MQRAPACPWPCAASWAWPLLSPLPRLALQLQVSLTNCVQFIVHNVSLVNKLVGHCFNHCSFRMRSKGACKPLQGSTSHAHTGMSMLCVISDSVQMDITTCQLSDMLCLYCIAYREFSLLMKLWACLQCFQLEGTL